jgi:hypothetical protein
MTYDIKRNFSDIKKKKSLDEIFQKKEKREVSFSFIGVADGATKNFEKDYINEKSFS